MSVNLKIAIRNVDDLANHELEVSTFLRNHNIDITLISETHYTNRSSLRIPNYIIYNTPYPSRKAHEGSAAIIKKTVKHCEAPKYQTAHLQVTNV